MTDKIKQLNEAIMQIESNLDAVEMANQKMRRQGRTGIDYSEQNSLYDRLGAAKADLVEAEAQAEEERKARIKAVVSKTADISAELAGRIVVRVSFTGSLPKTKKLTKEERAVVMKQQGDIKQEGERSLDLGLVGGEKRLFESKEYDSVMKFISDRRDEFASFGIPHMKFTASNVVDVTRIPEIEELAEKTELELAGLVDKLIEAYPAQITPEAVKLGALYNPTDYVAVEALKGRFKFDYEWMAFGVPEELKQFDIRIYEKAKAKAEQSWREIEANGVLLLRETIAGLVAGLVDSLTPKEDGSKKKFYASSVEKIQKFIDTFKRRNICNDAELDAAVQDMSKLVSGIDLKAMSSDMKLRESVKRDMEKAKSNLSALMIDAKARVFDFDEEGAE